MISYTCPHGFWNVQCRDCNSGGLCVHGNLRELCDTCTIYEICDHNRRKMRCSFCRKSQLKQCHVYYKVCSALANTLPPQLSKLMPKNERLNTTQGRIHNLSKG